MKEVGQRQKKILAIKDIEEYEKEYSDFLIWQEIVMRNIDSMIEEHDLDYESPRFSMLKKRLRNIKIIDAIVENCIIKIHQDFIEVFYDDGRLVAKIFDFPYEMEIWDLQKKELIHGELLESLHTVDIIEIMNGFIK